MKKENTNSVGLQDSIVFPMYLCSKELIRKYNTFLKDINLTYTQFVVMNYFWAQKSSNVKELGKIMLLDSSTLTPLLKKLEQKGFIKRNKSKIDERNLNVEITKKGEELQEKACVITNKMKQSCTLTKTEISDLKSTLMKILESIERENE